MTSLLCAGLGRLRDLPVFLLRQKYLEASPFPHLLLDDFLPTSDAFELERQCRQARTPVHSSNGFTQKAKTTLNSWQQMPPLLSEACAFFNSGAFLDFLEAITGVSGLLSDPYLEGGGLHRTLTGGYLKLHTDFSWNSRLRLHRRLNVLYYLNSSYQPTWGGELLLSRHPSKQLTDEMLSIEPLFNRLVVFNTNDTTFHGHPKPHSFPADYPRTSLAFYYYTASSRPWRERRRLPASTTRYVPSLHDPIALKDVPMRSRLGYWIRRWTPFA